MLNWYEPKTVDIKKSKLKIKVEQSEFIIPLIFSMFEGCTSLVGGAGTTYDEENVGYEYAHIDGGVSNPGYFKLKP